MSQGIGRPKEMERDWGAASLVEQSSQNTHNTFQLSLLSYMSMVHGAQNNLNSNIKGHWPQIIITNIMLYINKSIKFWHIVRITKMWQRHKMHKCCWKNGTDETCSMQGCYKHSISKKKALFAKCKKAKWIKMRHTYLYLKKDRYSTKMIFLSISMI